MKLEAPQDNCANCRFWAKPKSFDMLEDRGACRRYPPQHATTYRPWSDSPQEKTSYSSPQTAPDFWCGEWKANA